MTFRTPARNDKNLAESLAEDVVGKSTGPAAPTAPPNRAWIAAKKLAPYASKTAGKVALGYGAYRLGRDLIWP